MINLILKYQQFWEIVGADINQVGEFTKICDDILSTKKCIKLLFNELKKINRSNIVLDELETFYNTNIIYQPRTNNINQNRFNVK